MLQVPDQTNFPSLDTIEDERGMNIRSYFFSGQNKFVNLVDTGYHFICF
jgi:hypothetical protein